MPDPITGAPTIEDQQDQDEQWRLKRAAANQPLETPRIAGIGPAPGPGVNLPGLPGPNADVQQAHQRLAGLEGSSSGVDDPGFAQNHPIVHGIAKVGDVLGSIVAPGVTSHIPGTTLYHHAQIANAQNALNEHEKAAGQETAQAEQTAQAGHLTQETANLQNPPAKNDPEEAAYQSLSQEMNPETQKPYTPYEAYQKIKQAGQTQKEPTSEFALWHQQNPQGTLQDFEKAKAESAPKPGNDFEQYYHDYLTENKFPDTAHNRLLARERFAAAGQAPQRPQQQLGVINGKVVELKPGMSLPEGAKTLSGDLAGSKPNAEELKRSEMAENMNENLDKLEDIVKRRPELFGPLAGRETQARMWIGSNDADVGTLNTIKDQIGMAQQSAHSMRSAQHVEAAAASILNGFKNGPDAINSSIKTARDSLHTFTKDVQQGNPSVRKEGATPKKTGTPSENDPLGIR